MECGQLSLCEKKILNSLPNVATYFNVNLKTVKSTQFKRVLTNVSAMLPSYIRGTRLNETIFVPWKRQVDFTILAERDLGFSLVLQYSRWRINVQLPATEGELNFHKRCTEAREIKISAGNLERTYPKGFRQDIP